MELAPGYGLLPARPRAPGGPPPADQSKEVRARGIRVNTVSPGPVAKQAAKDVVTGRFTRPEEVADLVLLLASTAPGTSPAPTS